MAITLASSILTLKVACITPVGMKTLSSEPRVRFLLNPMLDGAGDHKDEFFLVGVIMEAVPLAGEEGPFEHSEVLGPRGGWIAQPAEAQRAATAVDNLLRF
jgi:hypothetical protein